MTPGAPGRFVLGFVKAVCEGRFADAELCLGPELEGIDITWIGNADFVRAGHAGLWGRTEITDGGDVVIRIVDDGGREDEVFVEAFTPLRAISFTVHYEDGLWSIVKIGR